MRFNLTTSERPKAVARRLRALLPERGMSLGVARNLSARLYGYPDWQSMSASLGTQAQSRDDLVSDPLVVEARRVFQVAVLTSDGIPGPEATRIVQELHPTSVRRRRDKEEAGRDVARAALAEGFHELALEVDQSGRHQGVLKRYGNGLGIQGAPIARDLAADLCNAFGGTPSHRSVRLELDGDLPHMRTQWTPYGRKGPDGTWHGCLTVRLLHKVGMHLPAPPAPPEPRPHDGVPYADLVEAFAHTRRDAWFPVVTGQGSPTGSRRYGSPWLPDGVAWPVGADGEPADFVIQVNPADLTPEARASFGDDRLVSFFYSPDAPYGTEGPQGDERATVLRLDPSLPGGVREKPRSLGLSDDEEWDVSPAEHLRFVRCDDYPRLADGDMPVLAAAGILDEATAEAIKGLGGAGPGTCDHRRFGAQPSDDDVDAAVEVAERIHGTLVDRGLARWMTSMACRTGDKVGGWPCWEQGADWRERDGRRLRLLLSIDAQADDGEKAHEEAGIMWGRGQLLVDPEDPDHLVYVWACD